MKKHASIFEKSDNYVDNYRPFLSEKYDITKHPQYKYLSDFDKRNTFDIEKYLSTKLKPKPDEVYDVYEIDLTDETETA